MREARGGTLIVGGGFAGATLARLLGQRGATIVSRHNFMLFTPLLPEAASGTLEPRHVVVPLRVMCPHAELVLGTAVHLDRERRVVAADSHAGRVELRYEDCVVALGAEPRVLPVPGLSEHAVGFNSLADAIHLRNHVLGELEAADAASGEAEVERHLTFVFVGGGYAGVEALAELSDLVHDALRHYPRLRSRRRRWVLVEAAPAILAQISEPLGRYAHHELASRGVEIRTSTQLVRVEEDGVELSDGTRIPTHTVVWTAGVRPSRAFAEWGLPLDERGRVRVTETLRVEGCDGLWALGDCARVPNAASGGEPDPPTSQHALRQARRLAKNLRDPEKPYRYRMLGQAATLGRYKGIMDLAGGRLRLRGFVGWFATRTYHLYQLPLFSRKLRVVVDWTTSLLFRRDIAELGTLGHPEPLGEPDGPELATVAGVSYGGVPNEGGRAMWASVRRYENNPELAEELAARSDEIKDLIATVPGFVSYYLIHDGSDTVSITVAQDKAGVDASNEIARNWLAEHASDVHVSTPHITEGEVLITTSG